MLAPGFEDKPKLAPGFNQERPLLPRPAQEVGQNARLEQNYIPAYQDLDTYRALNQSGLELFGKAIGNTVGEVVLGTLEGAGYLADFEQHYNKLRGNEAQYTNWFSQAMKDAKGELRDDILKTYETTEAQNEFAPWDATWWASNAPTIGSALSLMAPAIGVGGAASRLGRVLGMGAKTSETFSGLAATGASRYMEATMEANSAYDQAVAKGATPEQAGEAASKVWNGNWIFAAQDFLQYMPLIKGIASTAKGAKGISLGQIPLQVGSEAAEEAGQFILSEEAIKASTETNIDFFGRGFTDRLSDYVRDPEFQTAAFFGGIGGGIFAAAKPLAALADKGVAGATSWALENFAPEKYRPSVQKMVIEGLAKERANYINDTATSTRLDDIIFTRMVMNHLDKGRLNDLKAELEEITKDVNLQPGVSSNLKKRLEDIDFVADEVASLKNSNVPPTLHEDLIMLKVDYRQSGRALDALDKETDGIYQDLMKNKELDPNILALKKEMMAVDAYRQFVAVNPEPEFKKKLAEIEANFNQKLFDAKQTNPKMEEDLATTKDWILSKKVFQQLSLNERMRRMKSELFEATTPAGAAQLAARIEIEKKNKAARSVANKPDATIEELTQAELDTLDPAVKQVLRDKIVAAQNKTAQTRKDQTKEAVEQALPQEKPVPPKATKKDTPATKAVKKAEKSLYDTLMAPELQPNNTVPNEVPDLTTNEYEFLFGPEVSQSALEKVKSEVPPPAIEDETYIPDPEPPSPDVPPTSVPNPEVGTSVPNEPSNEPNTSQPTGPQPNEDMANFSPYVIAHNSIAHSWLKEIKGVWNKGVFKIETDSNGIPERQLYHHRDGRQVSVEEVFATDDNGILLINTPLVQPGMDIVLRVENDFPYTLTKGFRPTGPQNEFINIYLTDSVGRIKGKPIAQLASADAPTASEGDRILRNKVLASKDKRLVSRIIDKTLGDFVQTNLKNTIRILEADYHRTDKGWEFNRTAHRPVFGYANKQGVLHFPKVEIMKNVDLPLYRDITMLEGIDRPVDISPGTVVVSRTNPKGTQRVAQLHPRKINEAEVAWIKENIASYLAEGRLEELREVLNIVPLDRAQLDKMAKLPKDKIYWLGEDILFSSGKGWVKINARGKFADNFKYFMQDLPYNFQGFNTAGEKRKGLFTPKNTPIEGYDRIKKAFNELLEGSFRNINRNLLNEEQGYRDPITGKDYSTFYDYAVEQELMYTDIPGTVAPPYQGVNSGYSFFNSTIYIDPDPAREDQPVDPDNEIVKEVTPLPLPEPNKKQAGKKSWQDAAEDQLGGMFRLATSAPGFDVISDKELDWFKSNIGEEFLVVAKGVDRMLAYGGIEAFGWYYNGVVTVAQMAEVGTAYHEAFHFLFATQLNSAQRIKVLLNAADTYGIAIGKTKDLEEKLAEDFRLYMLSDGNKTPKVKAATGFFRKLLAWIKNLIGFKPAIDRLFEDFGHANLSSVEKQAIVNSRDNNTLSSYNDPRFRLLPGMMKYAQQQEAVMAAAHRVMEHAREIAKKGNRSPNDVLAVSSNLEKIMAVVKDEYSAQLSTMLKSENPAEYGAQIATLAAMGVADGDSIGQVEKYQGSWGNIGNGYNIKTGFQAEVLKALAKFGFTVVVEGKSYTLENETGNVNEEEIDEMTQEDEGERIYGLDMFVRSPRETLSGNIRQFLATVQEYEVNEDGDIIMEGDQPKVRKTFLGTPKYIDFNRVYSNLSAKLADTANPYTELSELSKRDPVMKAVYDAISSQLAQGNTRLFTEFQVRFNLSQYKFLTLRTGQDEMGPFARVIYSDQSSIDRVIMSQWREESVRKSFIESDGKVSEKKAKALKVRFDKMKADYFEAQKDKNRKPVDETIKEVNAILRDAGVLVPNDVWDEIKSADEPSNILKRLLFGTDAATVEQFFALAADNQNAQDPYRSNTGVNRLARMSMNYTDNLHAGVFLNEKNNQVNSVNLNSYITEKINALTGDNAAEEIAFMEQDLFYENNQLLLLLKQPNERGRVNLTVLSALREGRSEAKEFSELTDSDSINSRLISFYNNGSSKDAYIYLGTLSDKARQLMLSLPKRSKGNAEQFLKRVLRNTVAQESARIRRIQKSKTMKREDLPLPTDIDQYKNKTNFVYIPTINEVKNAAASLTDGEVTPEEWHAIDANIVAKINEFVDQQLNAFYAQLAQNGLIKREGKNWINVGLPEGVIGKDLPVEATLQEFFYNDFAWRTEISKIIHGDMAFYKDADTYFKRGYQVITPGYKPYIDANMEGVSHKQSTRRGIYQSFMKENTVAYLQGLASLSDPSLEGDKGKFAIMQAIEASKKAGQIVADNPAISLALQYTTLYTDKGRIVAGTGINKTDAQSLSTVDTWREIAMSFGQWTNAHETIYQLAWKDGKTINQAVIDAGMTPEDANKYRRMATKIMLQPLKPFQYGERAITLPDGEVMILKEQFKDSITPLIPEWTNKHTQYRELLAYMKGNNLDIMSSNDAVKIGGYGNITDFSRPISPWQVHEVPMSSLRFPQNIPPTFKEEITVGTQFWKLIFANMPKDHWYQMRGGKKVRTGELFEMGQSLWAERINNATEKLAKKLGLTADFRISEDPKERGEQLFKLKTLLETELASREMHDNYTDALQIVLDSLDRPDFALNINFPAIGSKFHSILTNLFKKNILKQKVPGFSLVNLADWGVSKSEKSSELHFLRNEDGNIVEAEVGIPLPYAEKLGLGIQNIDTDTNKLKWETLTEEQKKALQMIMYRIPTSGKNSMLPIRVVMILPASAGPVLLVPGEGTKQAGFDFDVDKSYIMTPVINDEGIVDPDDLDNKIFEVAWAILTDKVHINEMLIPINTDILSVMIEKYTTLKDPTGAGNIINESSIASPLSVVSDIRAEQVGKHAKKQIGVFSRFSTGHALLQHIIKDVYVRPKGKIQIQVASGYRFDEVGRITDNTGEYISNNHTIWQNAALDAQKEPKLGKLNVPLVLAALAGYMTDLGTSIPLTLDFINQPVIREVIKYYYQTGGESIEVAVARVIEEHPKIKESFDRATKKRIYQITEANLNDSLTRTISDNTEHQAQILTDFLDYLDAAQVMNTVNSVLSVDTLSDMSGIEALESFRNHVVALTDENSPIQVNSYIFTDTDTSPVKRVAAFYQNAINKAFNFLEQLYPYTSSSYNQVKDEFAVATGKKVIRNKDVIHSINQFLDYYTLNSNKKIDSYLSKYPTAYIRDWSYFNGAKNMKSHLDQLTAKHPSLRNNPFIKGLRTDVYTDPTKQSVKMIGVTNTNANMNKTFMTQGWWDLMNARETDIKAFAYDMVRYAIKTSGFQYSTSSFFDLVPVQFWVDSGIGAYHKLLTKSLSNAYGDGEAAASTYSPAGAVKSYIRHNFRNPGMIHTVSFSKDKEGKVDTILGDVKLVDPKGQHVSSFTLPKDHPLSNLKSQIIPKYVKLFDRVLQGWRLYESSVQNNRYFRELQPLGEPRRFYEVLEGGANKSDHPANKNMGQAEYKMAVGNQNDDLLGMPGMVMPKVLKKYGFGGMFERVAKEDQTDAKWDEVSQANLDTVIDAIIDNETDLEIKEVAKRVKANRNNIFATINIRMDAAAFTARMWYAVKTDDDGKVIDERIEISPWIAGADEAQFRRSLLHEIIHSMAVRAIRDPVTPEMVDFKRNITRIYEEVKSRHPGAKAYGLTSVDEFIAELGSNPKFRAFLRGKKFSDGIWARIVRWFRKLLGLKDAYDMTIDMLFDTLDGVQMTQSNFQGSDEQLNIAGPLSKDIKKNPSLFERVISSLKARAGRLKRSQFSYIRGQQLESRVDELETLANSEQGLLKYLYTANEELAELEKEWAPLNKAANKLSPEVIRIVQEHLRSYNLIGDIRNDIKKNPTKYVGKGLEKKLLNTIDTMMAKVNELLAEVNEAAFERAATIIKGETSEDLSTDDIKDQLKVADRDVTLINRLLDPSIESRDVAIRALGSMIKGAKSEGDRKTNELLYRTDKVKAEVSDLYNIKYEQGGFAAVNERYEQWAKKKGINTNSILDRNKPIIDVETLSDETSGILFASPLSKQGREILAIKKDSVDYPLREYYESVVLGYLVSQETIHPVSMRPGLRIPSIQRSALEAFFTEKGVDKFKVLKERGLDLIRRRYDETDYRATDEAGQPIDYLPIRFISKQDGQDGRMSKKEVSLDVATTVLAFIDEMHNYEEMKKVVSDAEIIKDVIGSRRVIETKRLPGFWGILSPERSAIVDQSGAVITKSGKQSNAYLWAEQFLRRMMYGQTKKDEGTYEIFGLKFDVGKTADAITKYTGVAKMALNVGIAATNIGVGEIMMVKEAVAGNLINWADWRYGKKMFAEVIPSAIADLGLRTKKTKFGKLFAYFDPMDHGNPRAYLGVDTNRTKKLFTPDILSTPNKIAEFEMASSTFFAVLHRYKAKNDKGEVVPLYEALEAKSNGSIGLAAGFSTDYKFDNDKMEEIRQYALRLNQKMNGIYNLIDSSGMRETALGRLVLLMRSWLKPGIDARWKLRNYDERLKGYDEGHYISSLIFFKNVFDPKNGLVAGTAKSLRYLFALGADDQNLLTPSELGLSVEEQVQLIDLRRANLRRTLFELYAIAIMSALMMFGWDDDDRDSYTLMMLARMRRELTTFFSPSTAWDVLRSPTVALNTIEDMGRFVYFSTLGLANGASFEEYEQGPRKGETRLEAVIKDNVPIWSQRHQFDDLERKIRLIERGYR